MPLEEGVFGLIIGGFSLVIGITFILISFRWLQKKNNNIAYFWTLLHLLLFSIAVYFLAKAISFDYEHAMASEENSLHLGIAGIIWAFSMVCLIMGIFKFSKSGKVISS